MNYPRLGYIILYVESVPSTVSFYIQAFGLKKLFIHESNQYAEMQTGQTRLAFADENLIESSHAFVKNRKQKTAAGAEIALIVEDVKKFYEHAIEMGATEFVAPKKKPWGQTVAYVRDNNGFIVEICDEVKS